MTELHPLRHPHDFYPTPPEATRALLSVESFSGPIWEPACGDGAIAKVLLATGHAVISTDLIDRGWGTGGVNFLTETTNRGRHIITNPPYGRGLADSFVRHALALTQATSGHVAMLLDLASLAHPMRTRLFTTRPPAVIYLLDELSFLANGRPSPTLAQNRYCWLVWKPEHTGRPSLWWLSPTRFQTDGQRR